MFLESDSEELAVAAGVEIGALAPPENPNEEKKGRLEVTGLGGPGDKHFIHHGVGICLLSRH